MLVRVSAIRSASAPNRGREPKLVFSAERLVPLVRGVSKGSNTLVVTDEHNFSSLAPFFNAFCASSNRLSEVHEVSCSDAKCIVAVGGCTALDVARAGAGGREVHVVPTILSTPCISVNKAILDVNGVETTVRTGFQRDTIIPLHTLMDSNRGEMSKWAVAGFGDFFGRLGAALDHAVINGVPTRGEVRKAAPYCFPALEWVNTGFAGYNAHSVRCLAFFLHQASLFVNKKDISAGGEHDLYYKLIELQRSHFSSRPIHGYVVSAATLLAARVFQELTGDGFLYHALRSAFSRLGLPTDYSGLLLMGIHKENLAEALRALSLSGKHGLLHDHAELAIKLLDEVFKKEK